MMTSSMDLNDVVIEIKGLLNRAKSPATDECCIYKVPSSIRRVNEDAYTPKVVSIGPFHHNRHPRLQNMEKHKLIYCEAFLERTHTGLESWVGYIEENEPRFRDCYSDTLEFSKEQLVKIIVVDAGFIFELFCRNHLGLPGDDLKPWLSASVTYDMLLLENQLPFFVLEGLFNLSFQSYRSSGGSDGLRSFRELTFQFFVGFNRCSLNFGDSDIRMRHFVDLVRTFHLQHPPNQRPNMADDLLTHLPSATELSAVGVRFKSTQSECLLDLKFSGRVIEIPQLIVDDSTELLFRNMLALEQCHYPLESYITDYVDFLDFLVNTSRDVDILVRKEVLVNVLGDTDSVANLFNGLMKNITQTKGSAHYFGISQELNQLYKNRWHNLKSTLRRDYCKSPWQTAASVAGILLLILSLIQAVCSILQVIYQQDATPLPKVTHH